MIPALQRICKLVTLNGKPGNSQPIIAKRNLQNPVNLILKVTIFPDEV